MDRNTYKYRHNKEHYDRINLTVPKGHKERIRKAAEGIGLSMNEYLFMLVCDDLADGDSKLGRKKKGFTAGQRRLLDKWQVAEKYRDMIESMDVEETSGTDKHYTIILKKGYVNDATGTRMIHADKTKDLRVIIRKSHKK